MNSFISVGIKRERKVGDGQETTTYYICNDHFNKQRIDMTRAELEVLNEEITNLLKEKGGQS